MPAEQSTTYAYVSSTADGLISQYRLDEQSGALSLVGTVSAGESPSPMATSPDGRVLYVALRGKAPGSVSFSVAPQTGTLTRLAQQPLPGSMAYLSTSQNGQWLLGASYGDDLLSVQPIDADGLVSSLPAIVFKTGLHAHSIRTDHSGRFVYVGNLGVDRVLQLRIEEDGELSPIGDGHVELAGGPRHLAFSPNGKFLYVIGETDGVVSSFAIDSEDGALSLVARAEAIPASLGLAPGIVRDARNNDGKDDPTPRIWAGDLKVSPDGTLLYITERTTHSVSALRSDPETGELSLLGNYPVTERQSRNVAFSPNGRWLLVTGEKSAVFGSYAINPQDGSLTRAGEAPAGNNPVWIELLRA
jgi:6-phosphogluconolactonase